MKLFEIAEVIPYDDSTSMKLAKQLYRAANGDLEKAKAMANGLRQGILKSLEKHHKMATMQRVGGMKQRTRPSPDTSTGYDETEPTPPPKFSEFA